MCDLEPGQRSASRACPWAPQLPQAASSRAVFLLGTFGCVTFGCQNDTSHCKLGARMCCHQPRKGGDSQWQRVNHRRGRNESQLRHITGWEPKAATRRSHQGRPGNPASAFPEESFFISIHPILPPAPRPPSPSSPSLPPLASPREASGFFSNLPRGIMCRHLQIHVVSLVHQVQGQERHGGRGRAPRVLLKLPRYRQGARPTEKQGRLSLSLALMVLGRAVVPGPVREQSWRESKGGLILL